MPRFLPNQPIIWATNLDDPTTIQRARVVKVSGEYVQYGPKAENSVHAAFVFPANAEAALVEILAKRRELKKAYDDSMKLIYELRNAVTRGEFDTHTAPPLGSVADQIKDAGR